MPHLQAGLESFLLAQRQLGLGGAALPALLDEGGHARIAFRGAYWPTGAAFESRRGTIEHFLTERYCLFTQTPAGDILDAHVHHLPWPLQPAAAEIEENTIARAVGIDLAGPPPLLHFSRRLDVAIWSAGRVRP